MGMYDAANLSKRLINFHMARRVGRRVILPLHLLAFQVHKYHIIRSQFLILNTAWLDCKNTALPVNLAYITPGKGNQPILREEHIRLLDPFL